MLSVEPITDPFVKSLGLKSVDLFFSFFLFKMHFAVYCRVINDDMLHLYVCLKEP